jgi:Arc/MetJ-type ribon-helix-helix transcriptional regulator
MKTTLDIPESTLNELLNTGSFSSKKEAVNTAIEAYLQNKRIEALLEAAGSMDDFMTQEELNKARNDG